MKIRIIKISFILFIGSLIFSCSTEPVEVCDYENDDIHYDCIQDIFDLSFICGLAFMFY